MAQDLFSTGDNGNLYVRICMTIDAYTMTHIAELEDIDGQQCRMLRVIELKGPSSMSYRAHEVTGLARLDEAGEWVVHGLEAAPQPLVPHPSLYDLFEDIDASSFSAEDFEDMWATHASRP